MSVRFFGWVTESPLVHAATARTAMSATRPRGRMDTCWVVFNGLRMASGTSVDATVVDRVDALLAERHRDVRVVAVRLLHAHRRGRGWRGLGRLPAVDPDEAAQVTLTLTGEEQPEGPLVHHQHDARVAGTGVGERRKAGHSPRAGGSRRRARRCRRAARAERV